MATLVALALTAAGCTSAPPQSERHDDDDPAITAALNDQLMIDPDLAGQNRGDSALEGGGVASAAMPTPERSDEEIAKARAEAIALAGGKLNHAPEPVPGKPFVSETIALTAGRAFAGTRSAACVSRMNYTFTWAARMPQALPVYPRAAVQESAGVDGAGCRLRAVNFRTPVTVSDVADFYHQRLGANGYRIDYTASGDARAISASSARGRAYVLIRPGPDNLTEADLITDAG